MNWLSDNMLGILADGGSFYLYDMNGQNLRKIADDVKSFGATENGLRIATLESNSLEIFTLNDPEGYYRFNLPNVADAQTALWYRDSDHLFISYLDHVAFLDLEDASLANFTTVSSGTAAQYNPQANTLYIIDPRGNLLRFDFPK
jgi:ligand-binding sensor domain-containing protein